MNRKAFSLLVLLVLFLATGCGSQQSSRVIPSKPLFSDGLAGQGTTNSTQVVIPRQVVTPTPKPSVVTAKNAPTTPTATATNVPTTIPTTPVPHQTPPTTNIPTSGVGNAPYGQPPIMTAEEVQLTQQLFALINSDRAARGLYPFIWSPILAGGARLHSWNMIHCGFSHNCEGTTQCQRIAGEGFAGYSDCGENIGLAGPYPTAWGGVSTVQESMMHEGATGWHFIHLTSTTLHKVGVGIVVDARGWIYFTEDLVS